MFIWGDGMEKMGTIYKIENLVNGKVYVGQTCQKFRDRVLCHKSKLRRNKHYNSHLQRAWNKYKPKNFAFDIIQECKVSEMDALEMAWIEVYQSHLRDSGYNLTIGGGGLKSLPQEMVDKIREKHFVKVVLVNTGEVFDSITEARRVYGISRGSITMCCKKDRNFAGRLPDGEWMVWRYLKEYDKEEILSFKRMAANNKKSVICLTTKETFETVKEASAKYNVERRAISKVLNGWQKSCLSPTHGRLQFCYFEERDKKEVKLKDLKKKRKVVCLTTQEVFDSLYQAGKKYGISSLTNIKNCCQGKRKTCGKDSEGNKLTWAYYD